MPITSNIKGLGGKHDQVIKWDDKLILGLTRDKVKRVIRDATLEVERNAKALIDERGAVAGKGVPEPSLPGRPPHKVTGSLLEGVAHEFRDEGLTGVVGTDDPIGRWLEFGTSKMAARPWLRPALSGVISRIEKFFGSSKF